MDIAGWRAHYTTNRTFDSDSHDWHQLPSEGVLVVVLYYDEFADADNEIRYRKVLDGDDYYWWDPGTETIASSMEKPDLPDAFVKEGTQISDIAFRSVKSHALSQRWP